MKKLTLRPSRLIKAKQHPLLMQRLADQIPPLRRHVVIHLAEDHNQLALYIARALKRVVLLACAQCCAVDVGREVAHCCCDAGVERAAVCEMAAETHAYSY